MPYCDSHTHTRYSDDSNEDPRASVEAAIEKGLRYIAITDHADPSHPEGIFGVTTKTLPSYLNEIEALKDEYKNRINVTVGLEVGYLEEGAETAKILLKDEYPEYVISSVHCVNGKDCYSKGFFDDSTRSHAIENYLKAVLESILVPYRIDAVGHLGYIERIMPYEDKRIRFDEFEPLLSEIFKETIKRELILEVNTSTGNSGALSLPSSLLLKAYYDLGGRLVTTSSDAHRSSSIARGFDDAQRELKKIGFKHLYVKQKGKLIELGI
ncbi:MAG: histidinol-phosphatase HisJ family protein [Clostridia bacterium]|nr:histidinol-phosphatase HisJ family protein [Clostridia bacterium]